LSQFSQQLIERSGYLEEGFPDVYDRFRPAPPREVLEILCWLAGVERPRLVVDVGSGTGLATRAWAEVADEVVGVEANPRMIERAREARTAPNVRYVEAFAAETGLAEGAADLVTSFQAFHWMEPQPALAEAARLLRDGGVFAAVDYDPVPVVLPEVDAAFIALNDARREARDRLSLPAGASTWPKHRHVEQIRASGRFRYARELVAHTWHEADAENLIGMAESIGGPRDLFTEAPEVDEAFAVAAETAKRVLGDRTWPMLRCYRIRAGLK
jgi:SAM-dependent methyltransferase